MKQISILILVAFFTILISCGNGKNKSSNYSSDVSYKKWLKDYESFVVNEYIPLMKKINAGDTSAMGDMQKYMEKATKLSEQATEMQGDLSGSDLSEFMTTYSRIAQKLSSLQ